MADMTIGQRIAEQRKRKGLSQEALGDKMGVSRQAISKWESDSAIPEVDKLIALSRLFGVSVGWLLGVEEEPQPQQPADTLSVKQLQIVEELVKKHPAKSPRPISIWISVVCLFFLLSARLYDLSSDIKSMSYAYNSLYAQYIELRSRVQKLEDSASNPDSLSLFGDYSFQITAIEADTAAAQIQFSAMPNLWREGDSGYLTISRSGMEPIRVDCTWNEVWLFSDFSLEIADGYDFCMTILHADGTQEQQVVTGEEVQDLATTLAIPIEIHSIGFHTNSDPLTLNLEYQISMPSAVYDYGTLSWKTVELIRVTGDGEELGRQTLLDAKTEQDRNILLSPDIVTTHAEILFEDLQLPQNQEIRLYLRAELSNGLASQKLVSTWTVDKTGTLRSQ